VNNYKIVTYTITNPIMPPNMKMRGFPMADPELGVSPLTGSPPFLSPVEVAEVILPAADSDIAGADVMSILPDSEMALALVTVPVPGKGARDGAEKLPKSLGSPVLLGILPVSRCQEGGTHTVKCPQFQ
jgi:hypothetical protein